MIAQTGSSVDGGAERRRPGDNVRALRALQERQHSFERRHRHDDAFHADRLFGVGNLHFLRRCRTALRNSDTAACSERVP